MKWLFIGSPIKTEKAAIQAEIWKNNPQLNGNILKWVTNENWHIISIFLGNTPESAVSQLQKYVEESFFGIPAINTKLT